MSPPLLAALFCAAVTGLVGLFVILQRRALRILRRRRDGERALARAVMRDRALHPAARSHEKAVRARIGMPAGHPEWCTRPWTRRERELLPALQDQAWPDAEWVALIRYQAGEP